MIKNAVKKLALALFKVATESNTLDSVNKSIEIFALQFFKATSIDSFHLNILNKQSQKEVLKLILESIKADEIFSNFIYVLVDTNNLTLLKDFLYSWDELQKEFQGYQKIELITAEELSSENEKKIEEKLYKVLGNKIFIEKKVDQRLIAGLIVRGKNFEFNDSILGKLNNISKNIKGALFNE